MRRPLFIAEQARHAKGLVGRLIAFIMARETWAENLKAIGALDVAPTDHVLDIGCGPGRALSELARRASKGRAAGVDPSELMVNTTVQRNGAHVRARLVDVAQAGVDHLPFADATFDKVLCVHVVYFWSDLDAGLHEVARVMKPGGRLALVFRSAADVAAARAFPSDVYNFPALERVVAALTAADLSVGGMALSTASGTAEPITLLATKLPT